RRPADIRGSAYVLARARPDRGPRLPSSRWANGEDSPCGLRAPMAGHRRRCTMTEPEWPQKGNSAACPHCGIEDDHAADCSGVQMVEAPPSYAVLAESNELRAEVWRLRASAEANRRNLDDARNDHDAEAAALRIEAERWRAEAERWRAEAKALRRAL